MSSEKRSSKSAAILYRPWGLAASLLGGLIAGEILQQVWKRLDPESPEDPPKRKCFRLACAGLQTNASET